jgi:hypothetical protein
LYLSATFTGISAAVTLTVFAVQHFRYRHYKREREQRKVAKATRHAETAKACSEKIERAKASIAGAAKGVSSGAAGFASTSVSRRSRSHGGSENKLYGADSNASARSAVRNFTVSF